MGCRILVGKEAGTGREIACFFDSTTDTAFGPIFRGDADPDGCGDPHDEAEAFEKWLENYPYNVPGRGDPRFRQSCDPRSYHYKTLSDLFAQFRREADERKAAPQ